MINQNRLMFKKIWTAFFYWKCVFYSQDPASAKCTIFHIAKFSQKLYYEKQIFARVSWDIFVIIKAVKVGSCTFIVYEFNNNNDNNSRLGNPYLLGNS